ncbi:hypothetical protein NIES4071_78760 [Calothrix sp. NIES-4071]|nr:hypothetical protein NIES4071_78760 [Calothrix sp. NIES-4071]BAZ62148.1 hypothetical protein NIES4105_78690 [Calothrix sp. NIES-4105]
MSQTFNISYWWEKLSEPDYFLEIVDATKIFASLNYFMKRYKGQFIISVQEHDACFDLRPDLSTIFEDIPLVLEKLTKDTHSPVEFDFFEQGTDVGMLMERQGDLVKVRFEITEASAMKFQFLPNTNILVSVWEFLGQWLQFIKAILDAMVELQPELMKDESYKEYITHLRAVEEHIAIRI